MIENEKFIEIYARLLIISQMDLSKDYQDKLIGELYRDFEVKAAEIDSSIAYFNAHPAEWVAILEKTRDKIQEIRKEIVVEEKTPDEIEKPAASSPKRDLDKDDLKKRHLRQKPSRKKPLPEEQKMDMRK